MAASGKCWSPNFINRQPAQRARAPAISWRQIDLPLTALENAAPAFRQISLTAGRPLRRRLLIGSVASVGGVSLADRDSLDQAAGPGCHSPKMPAADEFGANAILLAHHR